MNLPIAQQNALNRMKEEPEKWFTPYTLRQSVTTLQALLKRGLVESMRNGSYVLYKVKS